MLKDYIPLLMSPAFIKNHPTVYYSLNFPTYYEPVIYLKNTPKIMHDLRSIKIVMDIIQKDLAKNLNFQFTYFHTNKDSKNLIKLAKNIPHYDENIRDTINNAKPLQFPCNSVFFNGCVKISTEN